MKENEIYDRIDLLKMELQNRPYSPVLNTLYLSYNLMVRNFLEIEDHAENLSISAVTPCIFYEIFRGIAQLYKSNYLDANIAFKYSLELDPENPYGYLFKGIVNLYEGKSAKELFSKSLAFAYPFDKSDLMRILNENEDEKLKIVLAEENISRKEFIKVLEELVKGEPNNPFFRISLAETYYRSGSYREVLPLLENVIMNYPNYPHALFLMGKILDEFLNNHDKANEYFTKAFRVNPLSRHRVLNLEIEKEAKDVEIEELINLFRTKKPIVKYFEEQFEKVSKLKENKIEEKEVVKESIEKPKEEVIIEKPKEEIIIEKTNEEVKIENKEESSLDEGIRLMKERKYKEAIEFFLKELKKSQNKEE